jgi:hypothetical protein
MPNYMYMQAIQCCHWFIPFTEHRYTCTSTSSLHWSSLSNGSTQKLPQSHTSNVTHKVFNSHYQLFSNYEPFTVVSHLELTRKRASACPKNPWSDMWETLQLLHHCWNAWRHCWHSHSTLPHSCVIQVFIAVAWQQTRWGDARLATARLGMEKTPLHLLLRNRGSVFRSHSSCMA